MERTSSLTIHIYELAQAKRNYFYTQKEVKTFGVKSKKTHASLILLDLPRAAGYISAICSLQEGCYLLKATLSKHSALGNTAITLWSSAGKFLPASKFCSQLYLELSSMLHLCTDNKYSNIDLKGFFRFTLPYNTDRLNGTAQRINLRKTSICTLIYTVGKKINHI